MPPSKRERHVVDGDRPLRARAFGTAPEDLDVDFAVADRAHAATMVLAACLERDDGDGVPQTEIDPWTLARRGQALLAVRQARGGSREAFRAACIACGAPMELELELDAFVAEPGAPVLTWRAPDGAVLKVRLPTGCDQSRWIAHGTTDPAAIASALIESIDDVPPPSGFTMPESWLEAIGEALAARDPLTALVLRSVCPECGEAAEHAFDLERFLLQAFARTQRALIDEVGRLATAFHWREADIVALPAWRRARYLQRLDEGALG